MKKIILLIGALAIFGVTTGCEEEHEHWHHGGASDDYYRGYGYGDRNQPYYQGYPNYNYNYPYHH